MEYKGRKQKEKGAENSNEKILSGSLSCENLRVNGRGVENDLVRE